MDYLTESTLRKLGRDPKVLRAVADWVSDISSDESWLDASWARRFLERTAQDLENAEAASRSL